MDDSPLGLGPTRSQLRSVLSPSAALRRISSVEIDEGASHQREFHADALHRRFGFRPGRTSGRLLAMYCPSKGDILFEETVYTLYDARRPPRSEYHLYPATRLFIGHAQAGDLLVVLRTKVHDDLCIVVAARGGPAEAGLLAAYFPYGAPSLERFVFLEAVPAAEAESESIRTIRDLAYSVGFEFR